MLHSKVQTTLDMLRGPHPVYTKGIKHPGTTLLECLPVKDISENRCAQRNTD